MDGKMDGNMGGKIRSCRPCALIVAGLIFAGTSFAQSDSSSTALKHMSMQELMNIEVTLASKTPEKLSSSPSAIQVLTGEEIRRSGVTSLADALRLFPNVEVQQINSYAWVVSTRGFDALFSNKLLVMIDGRSVYTPLDAGVFWDAQNVLLEDVERIEVVSGPGGTLWGANAVNGVINIVTRNSKDTTSGYAAVSGGSFLRKSGGARYGNKIGDNLFYRAYGQYLDRNSTRTITGGDGKNEWDMAEGGFRMDYGGQGRDALMLQGNAYNGTEHNSPTADSTLNGQNLLGRWTRTSSRNSEFSLQMYFDRTGRRDIPSTMTDRLSTYDIDFQDRFPLGNRNEVLWGAGYRLMIDDTPTSTSFVGFVPQRRNMQLFSSFVQDETTLIPNRLKVIVGTKLEHNDFSAFELQPSVRVAWTPTERQTIWTAVSRAVRAPSRVDVDYHIPVTPPYAIGGGPNFDSEKLIAYEVGYRVQPFQKISTSVATFYNAYSDIYNVEPENPPVLFPYTIQNGNNGQSYGAELSAAYQPVIWWRLRGGYTAFHKDLWVKPGHVTTAAVLASLGNDPEHQFVVQSMTDLPWHFQFNGTFRHVSSLPNPVVPRYFTIDAQMSRRFDSLELSVVGQNLLEDRHPEYNPPQQVPRSVYVKIAWRSKS